MKTQKDYSASNVAKSGAGVSLLLIAEYMNSLYEQH